VLNILVSHPYITNGGLTTLAKHQKIVRLFIDSGAFTNWQQGRETSVEEYMDFLEGLPIKPWKYFVLDKVGDAKVTRDNYRRMLDRGLDPIPIFTRGTALSELDELYKTSNLVGAGVGVGSNNYRGYLKHVIDHNRGRPLHWLGVTNPGMVGTFKPFSCDSSSWVTGGRYGSIKVYLGCGRLANYTRTNAIDKPPNPTIWKSIRTYGFNPKDLQQEDNWRGGSSMARILGCQSWVRYALDVRKRFGTELFLACTEAQSLNQCISAYHRERELSVI
jgi:hypothetical protein